MGKARVDVTNSYCTLYKHPFFTPQGKTRFQG